MKIPKLAGVLLLGAAGFAYADAPEIPVGGIDWSGAYAGFNLGYAWGHADFKDDEYNGIQPFFPVVHWDLHENGLMGGMQAGYNWQRGRVVYGLEGELGYLDIDDKSIQGWDPVLKVPYDGYGTVDGGWYASLGARLGYVRGIARCFTERSGQSTPEPRSASLIRAAPLRAAIPRLMLPNGWAGGTSLVPVWNMPSQTGGRSGRNMPTSILATKRFQAWASMAYQQAIITTSMAICRYIRSG